MEGSDTSFQQSSLFEIKDIDQAPMTANHEEVVQMIVSRRLSLKALVKDAQSNKWKNLDETNDFRYLFPQLNFSKAGLTPDQVIGVVCISSNPVRLADLGKAAMQDPYFQKLDFYIPALIDDVPTLVRGDASLFKLWDDFYVGCVLESHLVKPNEDMTMYVLAFNLRNEAQSHKVVPYGYKISEDQKAKLDFTLLPWRWEIRRLTIAVGEETGEQYFEFRTASRAERAAKGAAVTAMTLGMLRYVPGYKGFKVRFRVVTQDELNSFAAIEIGAKVAAETIFTELGATSIKTTSGDRIPKDRVIRRFEQWLKLERIVDQIKETKEAGKEFDFSNLCTALFIRFLSTEYGAIDQSSFVRD